MWNFDISGLMLGMTVVLYDGNPVYPDLRNLWDLAEEDKGDVFRYQRAVYPRLHEGRNTTWQRV